MEKRPQRGRPLPPAPGGRGAELGREQSDRAKSDTLAPYFGARRIAPSSRITSPFSISLVTIWCTSLA
jgi:hypothetical protein